MFRKLFAALSVAVFCSSAGFAEEHGGDAAVARAYIKEIQADEKSYVAAHKSEFFRELAKGQHPRATVVTCSDSRVHTDMLDKTPEGDLFMVRNIGNQLSTAKGSVQYGVNHLGSSLLLFIGILPAARSRQPAATTRHWSRTSGANWTPSISPRGQSTSTA